MGNEPHASQRPARKRSAPSRRARERFLDAGLRVLERQGHASLKLAEVCNEAGATSGSFYYAFPAWSDYTTALINHWHEEQSARFISEARSVTDPRQRMDFLIGVAMQLPHALEAAIRVWAAHDPDVARIQAAVDNERRVFITETYGAILDDPEEAQRYASVGMYLLIGHESGTFPSPSTLEWGFRVLLDHAMGSA